MLAFCFAPTQLIAQENFITIWCIQLSLGSAWKGFIKLTMMQYEFQSVNILMPWKTKIRCDWQQEVSENARNTRCETGSVYTQLIWHIHCHKNIKSHPLFNLFWLPVQHWVGWYSSNTSTSEISGQMSSGYSFRTSYLWMWTDAEESDAPTIKMS